MDTIAMVSSLCAIFLHFFMTMRKGEEFLAKHLVWAFILTMIGMGAMAIAFATGLYAVLPHSSTLSFLCPFIPHLHPQNWRGTISGMVRTQKNLLTAQITFFFIYVFLLALGPSDNQRMVVWSKRKDNARVDEGSWIFG